MMHIRLTIAELTLTHVTSYLDLVCVSCFSYVQVVCLNKRYKIVSHKKIFNSNLLWYFTCMDTLFCLQICVGKLLLQCYQLNIGDNGIHDILALFGFASNIQVWYLRILNL